MKVSDKVKGEKTTSRQAPLPHGRLGSSEKPLNVASAPQRGANSPFATEGRGQGVGLRLVDLPTWEGVLMYDPEDLNADRPLRLWRVSRRGGKRLRYELKARIANCSPRAGEKQLLLPRAEFKFRYRGKTIALYRSHATMLAFMGFAIADRRHYVIDHINNITLDDRPSNLQVITQRENLLRSERRRETLHLSPKEKKRQREERVAYMDRLRQQLRAIHPDADPIDIEIEVTLELNRT